jgi:hypothetical protein
MIEEIYKQLTKKYKNDFKIWSDYLEFLFEVTQLSSDPQQKFLLMNYDYTAPKTLL